METVYEGKNELTKGGCTCGCYCYCLEKLVKTGLWFDADLQFYGEWAFPI